MMNKEVSSTIVNFMTLGARVLKLGRGYSSHYTKYASYYTLLTYSTLILHIDSTIILRDYTRNAAFLRHC